MSKIQKYFPILGFIFVVFGLVLVSYNYLALKKDKAYQKMAIEMFDYYSDVIVETDIVDNDDEIDPPISDPDENNAGENENPENPDESKNPDKPDESKKPGSSGSTQINYFVGTIEIPKIGLKRGFPAIDSVHNRLNENIMVVTPSDYPDVENGNLILASHSGSSSVSFFRNLYKLEIGDVAIIKYGAKEYTYKIIDIYIQPKTGVISIKRKYNVSTLTLVTCTRGDLTTQTVYIAERQ